MPHQVPREKKWICTRCFDCPYCTLRGDSDVKRSRAALQSTRFSSSEKSWSRVICNCIFQPIYSTFSTATEADSRIWLLIVKLLCTSYVGKEEILQSKRIRKRVWQFNVCMAIEQYCAIRLISRSCFTCQFQPVFVSTCFCFNQLS